MHTRLFLVLLYQEQLPLDTDFTTCGVRKLSLLRYWLSLSGHAFQEAAARTQAGRTTGQMVKAFSLVPKAGHSKSQWENAYTAIEKLMVAADQNTVLGLASKFDELYEKGLL